MVLDVSGYTENHPGGKFLIEHTIGTDISKFFYGGNAMDENVYGREGKRHNHRNTSLIQVDTMVIARLISNNEDQSFVGTFPMRII